MVEKIKKLEEKEKAAKERWILTELATTFSEDKDFLSKINRMTFGLLKENNL